MSATDSEEARAASKWAWYGAVSVDGAHVRAVRMAADKEMARDLLMEGWSDRLKAVYEIKRVSVTVLPDD